MKEILLILLGFLYLNRLRCCIEHGGFILNQTHLDHFDVNEDNEKDDELSYLRHKEHILSTADPSRAKTNLEYYASIDHVAGSAGDYHLAKFTRDSMRSYGFESEIVPMFATLSFPKSRSLSLHSKKTSKLLFQAPLIEPALESDPTSNISPLRNLSYLAYAASGKVVEKELVYANYGRPEDFKVLENQGISVKNKVVIVRYGECFRGLKIMNAEKRGAVAVLIYTDPQEDGFARGSIYPDGPWRPEFSVQRGSAQFNSLCLGDPFKEKVEEITGYTSNELVPKIPAIPISYGDALPFLKSLKGPKASSIAPSFVGSLTKLGVEYRLGPSVDLVSITVNNELKKRKIWNVISMIKSDTFGTDEDQPIIVGNHRDAWVFGAADPNSGSSLVLEAARTLGSLYKSKTWKPKRTIVFGSWSGEEHGLIGSTGWAESNKEGILKNAAAYINIDIGISGPVFLPGASASLFGVLSRVAKELNIDWDGNIGTLGSGSDYAVFLDYLGIPSFDLRYGQRGSPPTYGTYHSIYDSYHYIETVVDPDFKLHTEMAKVVAFLTYKLSTSQKIDINPYQQSQALEAYLNELTGLPKSLKEQLMTSLKSLTSIAKQFMASKRSILEFNTKVGHFERQFLSKIGLPKRPNFKSILQAPGIYLGYAAEVFPGIVHALRENDDKLLKGQVKETLVILEKAKDFLNI